MDPDRPYRLVTGVVSEALRGSGTTVVALAGEGPEASLLRDWLERAGIPFFSPLPMLLDAARGLMDASGEASGPATRSDPGADKEGEGDEGGGLEAWEASGMVARAMARDGRALLVGAENKTLLLLGFHPTGAPVLPLGDLHATEILGLAGGCTLPGFLRSCDAQEIMGVDGALRSYLEQGVDVDSAFGSLPESLRESVTRALIRSRGRVYPQLLIPKLGRATLGIDLDL